MLTVTGLNQYYGGSHILRDLAFEVPAGKVTALLGRNGVGKTTLLKTLMGLVPAKSGEVGFGEKSLTHAAPYERVRRTLFAILSDAERDRIAHTLRLIRLDQAADRIAGLLSHGQKQWLEIGMLLMQEPRLLLLDEPVAGMSDDETERTAELFLSLAGQHSLVVVEHDMAFIEKIARKVTVLHEGSVLAEGPMAQVQADPRVIEVYLGR